MMKAKSKKSKAVADVSDAMAETREEHMLFDGQMRKTFVEGVLQDIKGWFESKTDGKVEVMYEDFSLKGHEFGFKIAMSKGRGCTKQMFSESSSAFVNLVEYMFRGDAEQYDISYATTSSKVEVEFVSNW